MPRDTFRSFVNRAAKLPAYAKSQLISYKLSKSLEYQEEFLLETIFDASLTTFGKRFNFSNIDSILSFQNNVPLNTYETLKDYIDLCLQWKEWILTPYTITRFAKTAWTTSHSSKYIPVTNESLQRNHFQCSKDFLSIYINNNPNWTSLKWKNISLAWWFEENPFTWIKNIWYISSILSVEKPRRWSYFVALDNSYLEMKRRDQKIERIATEFIDKNITSISGVWPWIIQLWNLIKKKSWLTIQEIWPDFEVVLSWWVMIDIYKDQYKKVFWENINIYNMYNASEWFYWFQISNYSHELVLATNHWIFYEFIPLDHFEWENSKIVLSLKEVETNKDYALVITTCAWLRRYIVWDTIRFNSLNPYTIEVTWRTKYFIDAFSEHVVHQNVVDSLAIACKETNSLILEYTVWPKFYDNWTWCHEWIIEFEKEPASINEFIKILDLQMQLHNSYYEWKRANNSLMLEPIIHIASKWTFHRRSEDTWKIWWQFKIPNLWNTRKYIEEIIKYI